MLPESIDMSCTTTCGVHVVEAGTDEAVLLLHQLAAKTTAGQAGIDRYYCDGVPLWLVDVSCISNHFTVSFPTKSHYNKYPDIYWLDLGSLFA